MKEEVVERGRTYWAAEVVMAVLAAQDPFHDTNFVRCQHLYLRITSHRRNRPTKGGLRPLWGP